MEAMGIAKPTRLRVWAIAVSCLILGLPVLAFFLQIYVKTTEERRWEEMRRWCEQAAQEATTRDSKRPILRGDPLEGNAWVDYEAATASLGSTRLNPAEGFFYKYPNADRAKTLELVELHATALEALHRGASRARASRTPEWEDPSRSSGNKPYLLALLACCKSRFLVEDGHAPEAMDLLLAAAQYGADLARHSGDSDAVHGQSILSIVLSEMRGLLAPGILGRQDCAELARMLELLDERFPTEADCYKLSPATSGLDLLRKGSLQEMLTSMGINQPIKPTWRFGFSDRLVLVDAFQLQLSWCRQMEKAAGKPWKEAREIEKQAAAEGRSSKNPLIQQYSIIAEKLSDPNPRPRNLFRENRAQLRMLQGLSKYRADGEFPRLEDPFGLQIHSSITSSEVRIWSAGPDGVDDGGTGKWDVRTGKDIVLEVNR